MIQIEKVIHARNNEDKTATTKQPNQTKAFNSQEGKIKQINSANWLFPYEWISLNSNEIIAKKSIVIKIKKVSSAYQN